MVKEERCVLCNGSLPYKYIPMKEWKIDGVLCGKCYSKKIAEHYPGDHARVNLSKD